MCRTSHAVSLWSSAVASPLRSPPCWPNALSGEWFRHPSLQLHKCWIPPGKLLPSLFVSYLVMLAMGLWTRLPLTAPHSNKDIADPALPVASPGSVHESAHCGCGPICRAFQAKCCGSSACPMAWTTRAVFRLIEPCPTHFVDRDAHTRAAA